MSSETRQLVNETLKQRQGMYGEFKDNAALTQELKTTMRASANWQHLSLDKKQALEEIALKISRILNGDPEHKDNWHDIAGYAILAEQGTMLV